MSIKSLVIQAAVTLAVIALVNNSAALRRIVGGAA